MNKAANSAGTAVVPGKYATKGYENYCGQEIFVLVLNHTELLKPILEAMVAKGYPGATVFDCTGMLRELDATCTDDEPMMGVLRHFHDQERSRCKMIMATISSEERPALLELVNRITGGMDKVDAGIAFTLPMAQVYGLRENIG